MSWDQATAVLPGIRALDPAGCGGGTAAAWPCSRGTLGSLSQRRSAMQNSNGDIWKGAVAGVAGGLAASYAMTKFLALSEKASEIREAREHDAPHNPQHSTDRGEAESAR